MRNAVKFAAAVAASLFLASCLTSEGPLFDASNARARAFEPGAYAACQFENATAEPDCKTVSMTRDASGLYTMSMEGEVEVTYARFKRAVRGAYAAQLWGKEDNNPFYFLATLKGDDRTLSMISCEDLPPSFRDAYVKKGVLTVEDGNSTCVAKTSGAVVAAARAWLRTDAHKTGSRIVYTPKK
jgi:hypothetical protein